MPSHIRDFERRLRERGLRITAERRRILDHAFRQFWHFDAEELLASLRRDGKPVSRATVFRTLGRLVEAGVLRRHPLSDGRVFYEPTLGREHHEHLICAECGKILEFVQEEIERLQDEVCHEHRFRPLRHTLQIYGVCEDCQRREEQRSSVAGGSTT
jgi:Fur family ferric uptake transcriptional regulator